MTDPLFSSWLEVDIDPTWRQRGLVIATFAAGGIIAGALSALAPGVDFRLSHLVQASLSATLAALPLAGGLFKAGRRRDLFEVTLLSLALVAIGYLVFALQIAVADAISPSTFFWEGQAQPRWYDRGHLEISAFLTWGVFLFTWKVYVPCALITGWAMSFLLHRRVRATAGTLPPEFRTG